MDASCFGETATKTIPGEAQRGTGDTGICGRCVIAAPGYYVWQAEMAQARAVRGGLRAVEVELARLRRLQTHMAHEFAALAQRAPAACRARRHSGGTASPA